MFISKSNLSSLGASCFKNLDIQKANTIFNAVGIEVEEVIKVKAPEGLVVGKIIELSKLEGSKKLNYCLVETLTEKLNIVCGAQNIKEGDFVVVATIGTKFSEDFVIQKRKILDHESCGMICAYSEICPELAKYSDDYEQDKVIILDNDVELKTNAYDYLNLNDEIYNLSIPSNRNDLNSNLALLNELNYQINYGFKLNQKPFQFKLRKDANISVNSDLVSGHAIGSFEVPENYKTPWAIKKFLINSQVNVHNTIADYANYITLLTGNPIHFYDADSINSTLRIQEIQQPTKFTSLLGQEIEIPTNSLVSLDANDNIACLIGVIGADYSKVTQSTKKVIFEVLNLNSDYARELSEKLKIKNTSVDLFSKPIPNIFINYAVSFIQNLFSENNFQVLNYSNKIIYKKIKFNPEGIQKYLGVNVTKKEITDILEKSGFKISGNIIWIPPYRLDIFNTFDLAEEVLKSLDINRIAPVAITTELNGELQNKVHDYQLENKIRDRLIDLGLYDFKTMNLVSKKYTELFNFYNLNPYIISNPISSQREYYRTSLIPSLLESLKNNINKKSNLFNCFEIQKIYSTNKNINTLTILITKPFVNDVINSETHLETDLVLCLNTLQKTLDTKFDFKVSSVKEFSCFSNEIISQNKHVGYFGKISKTILKQFDLEHYTVYAITLNLDDLNKETKTFTFKPISQLNPIYRVLTFKNSKNNDINKYINFIKQQRYIEDVNLDKIYIDNQKNKFYTINIKIVSDQNLTNQEIESIFNFCINSLSSYELELKK